jgi:hypothetical protein
MPSLGQTAPPAIGADAESDAASQRVPCGIPAGVETASASASHTSASQSHPAGNSAARSTPRSARPTPGCGSSQSRRARTSRSRQACAAPSGEQCRPPGRRQGWPTALREYRNQGSSCAPMAATPFRGTLTGMRIDASSTILRRRFGGGWEAAAALGAAALVVAGHRVGRRSGVSTAELHATLPGDELVPQPVWTSTRATTIAARPELVWPRIVQMGHPTRRAGWYTPHWLDRVQWGIHARSAERRPQLQHLAVGDRPGGQHRRIGVLHGPEDRALRDARAALHAVSARTRALGLVLLRVPPDPGRGAESRLTIGARVWYAPRWARLIVGPLIAVGDFLNASSMLRGIRRRPETTRRPRQMARARSGR